MFEKESQDYAIREVAPRQELYIKGRADIDADYEKVKKIWQRGAEFGYNKAKKQSESIIKRLLINRPDTYSGTDVMTNQTKMFAFASAVNDAIEYLKESE